MKVKQIPVPSRLKKEREAYKVALRMCVKWDKLYREQNKQLVIVAITKISAVFKLI